MQHKTLDEIGNHADILPSWLRARPLSKCERLERWAEALEHEGGRRLKTLFEIEYARPAKRAALRADDSPLSVAFGDQRLRADGLAGDTVGDAIAFFGISETELHNVLCFCYHGETMSAEVAAVRVRVAATRSAGHEPLQAPRRFVRSFVAVLIAIGGLTI
jgi:hypothetical protein